MHVVAASKAMKKGDWKQCKDYILAVKVTETFGNMCTRGFGLVWFVKFIGLSLYIKK